MKKDEKNRNRNTGLPRNRGHIKIVGLIIILIIIGLFVVAFAGWF